MGKTLTENRPTRGPLISTVGALVVIKVLGVSTPLHSNIMLRSSLAHSNSVLTFPITIYIGIHATV